MWHDARHMNADTLKLLDEVAKAVGDNDGNLMRDEIIARCRELKALSDLIEIISRE